MRYRIPVDIEVEASSHAQALANARSLSELLSDPLVQSTLRGERIDARGISVKSPVPIGAAAGDASNGQHQ